MNAECGMRSAANKSGVAFLWDESFLWGVMAYKALRESGLAFELIRSEDVRKGRLDEHEALFVPGGWASNKIKTLGDDGVEKIRRFVRNGGAYVGFCGGAGLATMDGIGLAPVKRRPTKERVPSFSGRIRLSPAAHPLWQGITDPVFHAWWPSQFVVDGQAKILATYGEALPDSFSSDLNVGDAEAARMWADLERVYRINLDPKRLSGEPAVIEARFGDGSVILSLVHFDTLADPNGAIVLKNLWKYLKCRLRISDCALHLRNAGINGLRNGKNPNPDVRTPNSEIILELETAVNDLIDLGMRNFLWFRRNPLLLQWRRGVRGLEYCTLYIMVRETAEFLRRRTTEDRGQKTDEKLERIRDMLLPFITKAKRLLLLERYAMQNGHITYEKCDDPEIQSLREELFSLSKSHGGSFKRLIDELDEVLFGILTDHAQG